MTLTAGEAPHDPARWRKLQDVFAEARTLDGDERERLLLDFCGDDPALLLEVRALLAADVGTGALDALAPRLASLAAALDDTPPATIGPYTVDAEAGRGGMGVVYRGFDPRLRRNVAIKLVAGDGLADATIRQRFINEARLASALDHPNICTIYDIGALPDGRIYLTMAYYGRGTLADRLMTGPLPVEEAVAIARQLAGALACAHEAGIVHRDVKPRNVAFGERGEARLLDFGVALLGHDAGSAANTAGTPGYMAPEQVRGDRVDGRADVWALGVVLFEMLCGHRPFEGDRADVLRAITETDAPDLLEVRPDVPPALAATVARALRRAPAERFATVDELDAALAGTFGAAEPAVAGAIEGEADRGTTIRRVAMVAGLAAVVAAVAFMADLKPGGGRPADGSVDLDADYYLRGRARYHEGSAELEAAIALFRRAVEHDPQHAQAHAFLARAYARATLADLPRQGQLEWVDSAEVHAHRALALAPGLPDGHAALGSIARARGEPDAALAHHARALALDAGYVYSHAELGEIHHDMKQIAEAVQWQEQALAIDRTLDDVRVFLIVTYRSWELFDDARRLILEGLQLKPDHASLLWQAAQLELVLGDTVAARGYMTAFLPLLPPLEQERMRAWYEYIRGDREAALPYADRVASAASSWFDLRMYGMLYVGVGDSARGRPLLRRAIDAVQSNADVPGEWPQRDFVLGHLFAGLGEYGEALRWLSSWEEAGGFRSWRALDQESSWGPLREDDRFLRIVGRSGSEFQRRREQIMTRPRAP